jgi:hypothetical protein
MLPVGEEEASGQSWQLPDPVAFLYLPAPHASHLPPSAPDQPALQVQLLKAVLCSGELEFAGQLLQLAAPDTFLYSPAPHGVHVSPSAPDQPALQVQFLKDELPAGESELVGHLRHAASAEAPTVEEYVPILHWAHVE